MDSSGWVCLVDILGCRTFSRMQATMMDISQAAAGDPKDRLEERDRHLRLGFGHTIRHVYTDQGDDTLTAHEAEALGTAYHASTRPARRSILERGILPSSTLGVNGGRNDVHSVSSFPDGIVARKRLPIKAQELWWIDLSGMSKDGYIFGKWRNGTLTSGRIPPRCLIRCTSLAHNPTLWSSDSTLATALPTVASPQDHARTVNGTRTLKRERSPSPARQREDSSPHKKLQLSATVSGASEGPTPTARGPVPLVVPIPCTLR